MIPRWHRNTDPIATSLGRAFSIKAEVPCAHTSDGLASEEAFYDSEEEARAAFDGAIGERGLRRLRLEDWRTGRPVAIAKWRHPKLKRTWFA